MTETHNVGKVLRLWVVEGYEQRNGGVDAHVSTSLFYSQPDARAHAIFCMKNEHCDYTEVFECTVNEEANPDELLDVPCNRCGDQGCEACDRVQMRAEFRAQSADTKATPGRTRAEVLAALGARLPSAHSLHDSQGYAHGLQEAIALVSQMADAPARDPGISLDEFRADARANFDMDAYLASEPDCAPITELNSAEATAKLVAEESERRLPIPTFVAVDIGAVRRTNAVHRPHNVVIENMLDELEWHRQAREIEADQLKVGNIVTCRGESDSTFTVMALGTSRALLVDSKGRVHGWEPLHKLLRVVSGVVEP